MAQQLTPKEFHAISRDVKQALKDHKYNAQAIGKAHKVSHGTVTRVRHAKTWNGFLALKASRQTSPRTSAVEKELIENVGKTEQRAAVADAAEIELARTLEALAERPTRSEVDQRFKSVNGRQDILLQRVRESESSINRQGVAITVLIFLVVVTFVIAVVK